MDFWWLWWFCILKPPFSFYYYASQAFPVDVDYVAIHMFSSYIHMYPSLNIRIRVAASASTTSILVTLT